jgi:hypothetical protein
MRTKTVGRQGYAVVGLLAAALMLPLRANGQIALPDNGTLNDPRSPIPTLYSANYHQFLTQYYRRDAERLDSDARIFAGMAGKYRAALTADKMPAMMSWRLAAVCEGVASDFNAAARESRELAAIHEEIAGLLVGPARPADGPSFIDAPPVD